MRSNEVTTGTEVAPRGGRRRPTRGRRAMTWALMLAMTVSMSAVPRVSYAEFEEPGLKECFEAVEKAVVKCYGEDPGFLREYACEWLGGTGLIACLTAETIKMIVDKLAFPPA